MARPLFIILVICCALQALAGLAEIFRWDSVVDRLLPNSPDGFIEWSEKLGDNMGLYNLFLAAGFVWAIVSRDQKVAYFFLACMTVAGLVGAATVSALLVIQAVPPALGLIVVARR